MILIFYGNKNLYQKLFASLMIFVIIAGFIFSDVLLPIKNARAYAFATLPMQIVQWIMDKIWEALDYANQELQKLYGQITASIQQWTKFDTLYQRALKNAWNVMRSQLLKQLSENILKWAQGSGGNTNFVFDWAAYNRGLTTEAVQRVIDNDIGEAPFFSGYATNLKTTVQKITDDRLKDGANFHDEVSCPIPDDQMASFYNGKFTWDGFAYALQNNYYTDLFASLDLAAKKADETQTAEYYKLIANQGFKGDGAKTPGVIQSYAAQRASMMDLDYLLNSPDLNTYVSSLADAFITRIMGEGLSGMKMLCDTSSTCTADGTPAKPPVVTIPPTVTDINYIETNYDTLFGIKEQVQLILDNLNQMRKEQDTNLPLMLEIKGYQDACGIKKDDTDIGPELADMYDEIDAATSSIPLASSTVADLIPLLAAADAALAADKAGDTATVSSSIATFKTILDRIVNDSKTGSLQILLNSKSIALDLLYITASSKVLTIAEQTANYVARRGDKKAAKSMPETLYGQLKLAKC